MFSWNSSRQLLLSWLWFYPDCYFYISDDGRNIYGSTVYFVTFICSLTEFKNRNAMIGLSLGCDIKVSQCYVLNRDAHMHAGSNSQQRDDR